MDKYRVLEIKESVFESNDREAEKLRGELKQEKTFLLNLMSSPGSGKTTTLMATIEALKDDMRIGIMEADIDSDVDAATIEKTGVKVIQLHTGGMCHLDAGMTRQGLEGLGVDPLPLPQGAPLRYEVLQMGFARMREDPAAESFRLWLRQKNRDAQTALSFGLVPLQPLSAKGATALETTLIRLSSEAELVPIDPGAGYLKNRDACEQALRLSLDLLQ